VDVLSVAAIHRAPLIRVVTPPPLLIIILSRHCCLLSAVIHFHLLLLFLPFSFLFLLFPLVRLSAAQLLPSFVLLLSSMKQHLLPVAIAHLLKLPFAFGL